MLLIQSLVEAKGVVRTWQTSCSTAEQSLPRTEIQIRKVRAEHCSNRRDFLEGSLELTTDINKLSRANHMQIDGSIGELVCSEGCGEIFFGVSC